MNALLVVAFVFILSETKNLRIFAINLKFIKGPILCSSVDILLFARNDNSIYSTNSPVPDPNLFIEVTTCLS